LDKQHILFHNKRHPNEMGCREIEQFLTHLAVEKTVAASTQNQALCALLFLHREVGTIVVWRRLRLMEYLTLWVKDVGFEQHQIMVCNPKGMQDRAILLPETLHLSLQAHLQAVKHLYERDLAFAVCSTHALECKYPHAAKEWS
jgi:hypothetical protein